MDPHRAQRVSEALREELAELIEYELSDPRVGVVTVTNVHVTPDLKHAHVAVALSRKSDEREHALQALEHARHYLRRQLAGRLRLYRVPELHFEEQEESGAAGRVDELLDRLRKQREKNEKNRP